MRGKSFYVMVAMVGLGLLACVANAAVIGWDFTVDPTQEAVPMTGYARGAVWDGGTANGTPYGGSIAGTGLQGDGTAIFADATTESSNSGFVIGGGANPFTMDLRIKVLEDVTQSGGKSISFRDATGNGRGMKLQTGGIDLVSSGVVRSYGPIDLTQWTIIRNSFPGNGTVDTYIWNGSAFVHLGNQGMGGSGYASEIVPAGIGIGSLGGSSTQSGKFQIDFVYIDDAVARGDTPPPMPEPATLAMLTICAIPLLRRRH